MWKWERARKNNTGVEAKERLTRQDLQKLTNSGTSRFNLNQQKQRWNSKASEKKGLIIQTAADFMQQG